MYIIPFPKSPLPHKGRIGKREQQDWYRGIVRAAELAQLNPLSKVWVISALKVGDRPSEADLYLETLLALGVPKHQIEVFREGFDTMEQVNFIENRTLPTDEVTLFVAPFHYFRVLWFTYKLKHVNVVVAWGLPRIAEAITDSVFTFLFPIGDMIGLRPIIKKIILWRRKSGKQF